MANDGLVFEQLTDTVLEARDTISNQQCRLESSEPMEVHQTEYDDFPGPVTDAVSIDTGGFQLPVFYAATVRDENEEAVTYLGLDSETYTAGDETTFIEFHTPVKSYLRIDGPFECAPSSEEVLFSFSDSTEVILGSRAWRRYPSETITVSDSLTDLREAISYFGDEMLTSSPERSYPTLRGHPPRLRVGESLNVPDALSKPETGITITVPRDRAALLTVTPLAYYLLATVEFGTEFTVQTNSGLTYRPPHEELSDAVKSILTRCFFLDCIVRTEGLYPFDSQLQRDFESRSNMELDFAELYEKPLSERTEDYLQVDAEVMAEISPDWPITTIVEPEADVTNSLPYLVYELAHIEPADPPRYTGDGARKHALEAFTRGAGETRSTSLVFDNQDVFVNVPQTESNQTVWVGDGIPLNASKFVLEGYENNATVDSDASSGTDDSPSGLEITVVCNDAKMAEEPTDIRKGWGPRDDFPMELTTYSQVSTDQLRRILESGTDYLHFVGHATPDGLECIDGFLDVTTIEECNVETFFLNACQSYQQGKKLVKQGSSGGIVTYSDVADSFALRIGSLVSRLLSEGFPTGTCLSIVRETTPIGQSYTLVGTHAAKIIQPDGGPPYLTQITEQESGYTLEIAAYAAGLVQYSIGSGMEYAVDSADNTYLVPSEIAVDVGEEELREFLSMSETPVIYEGELQTKAEFFDAIEE